ncbi:hypothetical protein K788_0008219 [Paraburkholderia caribensis MBA4]|uniref:Uncharacterized protein n=1 Tax=Paraburkholderia caribensis MBA4 TaxID=1323664 RepID=A0A0P0RF77_9BURK|nr:hypothetical protein K788_0008219 [Paraburkholderia caribensis MBA4]
MSLVTACRAACLCLLPRFVRRAMTSRPAWRHTQASPPRRPS